MKEIRQEIQDLTELVADQRDAIDQSLDASSQVARAMEELARRQRSKNRFQQLNSFVAYIIFTLLIGGAFYVLYISRAADLVRERDAASASAQESRDRARDLQDRELERQRSERLAAEHYQLMRQGRYEEVIDNHGSLDELSLSETERSVFDDGLAKAKAAMVEAGYRAGVEAFERGAFEAATAELRRGLTYAEESERAAQMRYFLGISLSKQGSNDEAVAELEKAIDLRVEQSGLDDARFQLANALVSAGNPQKARHTYAKFAARYPNHKLAQPARRRASQIMRQERQRERMEREQEARQEARKRAQERLEAQARHKQR